MKRSLTALCLLLCLAPTAAAQDRKANATGTPDANVRNTNADVGNNANINADVGTNANANVGANANNTSPVTLEVQPGQTAKIVVGTRDEAGGFIPRWLSDAVDLLVKVLGLASIIFAGLTFHRESVKNRLERKKERLEQEQQRRQREEELRWKKAQLAKEVLDKLNADPYATDAMLMLDWSGREFCVEANRNRQGGEMLPISWPEMWAALRVTELHFNDKEKYVRDCFDEFFGYMQRLAHYISIKLIDPVDVRHPFDYYIVALDRNEFMFGNFIETYHPRVPDFIRLVKSMREADPVMSPDITSPPEVAASPAVKYFMFDCPPGEERFILALEDPAKIEVARAILRGDDAGLVDDVERHVTGTIVNGPAFYNAPWLFHVDPDTVEFPPADQLFADEMCQRVEWQKGKKKSSFEPDDVWHTGGARLLAELPASRFNRRKGERRDGEEEELQDLGRVARGVVTSPPGVG
jgi:hypothetical protein